MLLKPTIFTRTCRTRRGESGVSGVILGKYLRGPRLLKPILPRRKNTYRMGKYRDMHGNCEECIIKETECTHHIVRFVDGGEDIPENYMALCTDCHKDIHRKSLYLGM